MRLGPPATAGPAPTDVAAALVDAQQRLGHRPAVTVLSVRGREEQGVASLAQWAAKGAHLLELDYLLEPGEAIRLDAPLSWTTAAVCLAAWWAGLVVDLDGGHGVDGDVRDGGDDRVGGEVVVAVVHEDREPPAGVDEVLRLGDAIDGAPVDSVPGEPWVRAVQAFPDQPPTPRCGPQTMAVRAGGRSWTQADLLGVAADQGAGTLGLDAREVEVVTGIVAVALRPLVVGRPTVVLHDVERDRAGGERVSTWL